MNKTLVSIPAGTVRGVAAPARLVVTPNGKFLAETKLPGAPIWLGVGVPVETLEGARAQLVAFGEASPFLS